MNKNIVIGLLVAVILVGGYFSVQQQNAQHEQIISGATVPMNTQATTSPSSVAPTSVNQAATSASTSGKKCASGIDCFIAQVSTCGPATTSFSMSFYGKTITSQLSVAKTATAGTCSFTDNAYGTKQVCSVPAKNLVAILTRWKAGTFDSNDLSGYACTTTMSDGTSFDTSPTSGGSAVATHGYTYSYTDQVGGSLSDSALSYKVLAISSNSLTLSFTNNQTNQSGTVTAQLNVPVVFAGYTITFTGVSEDGASFTLKQ